METIESLHERVEVLEDQIEALIHRAHLMERRLRWWCALVCGLLVLLVVSLSLLSSMAQDESSEYRGIRKRLAAIEYKLQYVDGGPQRGDHYRGEPTYRQWPGRYADHQWAPET